ncbi:hypothetical protein HPP92_021227 [Vanilla planifolia]|uniref:Uncharacterized protein n=1 Tax=Vanilla planifolia TaxID=51239 RepID=A0A835Q243_VANPL|nr:hypothetical protein HPP92_021227 [Vanilla planifolia]
MTRNFRRTERLLRLVGFTDTAGEETAMDGGGTPSEDLIEVKNIRHVHRLKSHSSFPIAAGKTKEPKRSMGNLKKRYTYKY